MGKTTDNLVQILKSSDPETIAEVLESNKEKLYANARPFASYFRDLISKYSLAQNEIIETAGFSLPYGYRLLSEERHTKQRDYILRFCIVAGFSLEEIQRLLKLYGMSPLYPRIPRDAVLITSIVSQEKDINEINRVLSHNGFTPLKACAE